MTLQQYRWLMEALRLAQHKQFGASSEKREYALDSIPEEIPTERIIDIR